MPIYKKFNYDKTTQLTNAFLQDDNISLEAKGLLGYLLSLPVNWDFTIKGISTKTKTSEYKITKLLQELEANGYHTKRHLYENGRIKDWIYYIFAEPRQDIIDGTFNGKEFEQDAGNQDVEKQDCCFQYDKQIISNKLDITKEEKKNNIDIVTLDEPVVSKKEKMLMENVKCIVDYLNESIGAKYRTNSKETISLIKARFKDGYKLDDFYDVIDKKVKEWINTDMQQYLRPSTLFGNKFESYFNQKNYFQGNIKSSYGSKPTFDNTATHTIKYSKITDEEFNRLTRTEKVEYLVKIPVADMTELQRIFYDNNCIAKDENGNDLEF